MTLPSRCPGITRRSFLADTGMGFTGLALGALLHADGVARGAAPPPVAAPGSPRAKNVIWIFLCGGVSHVESFDPKPMLTKYAGKTIDSTPFKDVIKAEGKGVVEGNPAHGKRKVLMALNTGVKRYGKCGLAVGDWWRHIGECAD